MPAVKPPQPLSPAAEAAFKNIRYELGKRDSPLMLAYVTIAEETMRLLAAAAEAFQHPVGVRYQNGDLSVTYFGERPDTPEEQAQRFPPVRQGGPGVVTERPALATFGDRSKRRRRWLLRFEEDNDRNTTWDDDEAEAAYAAYRRYTQQGIKCTLFVTAYER